jgi:DNA-directed RNA polymerase specialized sigma24 family protein
MDTTSYAIHMSFRTALILAGATRTAELAVLDGIDACESINSHRSLLIETVRSAIRRRAESPAVLDGINLLPPELRRVLGLQPIFRDCFVLRILVELSPEECVELLKISITEYEAALSGALNQLPLLSSVNADRDAQG